jgi:WhiB family redox-sensing transcriptional regulator
MILDTTAREHQGGDPTVITTLPPIPSGTWRNLARCRGVNPEIFHPVNEDDGDAAKAVCELCPVREPCLEYALTAREKDGIWGGLTARERRRVIRQRRKTA